MRNVQGFTLGSIAGIQIGVDLSWILMFIFVVWSLATGLFSSLFADHGTWYVLSFSVIATALFFVSIVIHELAHSVTALRFGIPVRSITLFVFGGVAAIEKEPETPGSEFAIVLVGPLTSLFLGVVCFALSGQLVSDLNLSSIMQALYHIPENATPVNLLLTWLGSLNLSLGIFNLLPGFPMDGGRLLRALLWKLSGKVVGATAVATAMGKTVAIAFMGFGILSLFGISQSFLIPSLYTSLWMVVIGSFLYAAANKSYHYVLVREALGSVPVAEIMDRRVYPVYYDMPIKDLIDNGEWKHVASFAVVNEEHELVGLLYSKDIASVADERIDHTVADIMIPIDEVPNLSVDEKASHAFLRLDSNAQSHLPVFDKKSLKGIIGIQDILSWLKNRSSLSSQI